MSHLFLLSIGTICYGTDDYRDENKKYSPFEQRIYSKDHCREVSGEGVEVSRAAIYNLIKKFKEFDSIADMRKTPRPRILQEEHYRFIDDMMAENMDLTERQLFALFEEKFTTDDVSLSTIKRARLELGWVSKRAKYCQLIAKMNKEKGVMWCVERVTTNDLEMNYVIFADESTVQIEGH